MLDRKPRISYFPKPFSPAMNHKDNTFLLFLEIQQTGSEAESIAYTANSLPCLSLRHKAKVKTETASGLMGAVQSGGA